MASKAILATVGLGVVAVGVGAALTFRPGLETPEPVAAPTVAAPSAPSAPRPNPWDLVDEETDAWDFESRMAAFDWDAFQRLTATERFERMREMRAEWEKRLGDTDDERIDSLLASPAGQRILDRYDADGDGLLSDAERQALLEAQARREARMQERLLERFDRDGDGVLSEAELLEMEQRQQARQEEWMQRMAEQFDRDGDGLLDEDERNNAFQTMRERREIDAFVRRYDADGDGRIGAADFNAFLVAHQAGQRRADVNRDGQINALDVTAFRDMMARASNRP